MRDLVGIIKELIDSKKEGDFWDFKEEHHSNKVELLHDILCLSNSLCKGDRYIIYGVSDATFEVIGLNQGLPKLKQSDIIDFLRSQKFAGGYKPDVELKSVHINNVLIDVLIIKDSNNTPFYITEDKSENKKEKCKKVRANYIYSRTGDSNTPIDKSADIFIIEKLWQKRFGLNLNPLEKLNFLLNDINEWDLDLGNRDYGFHKQFPEFRLQFEKCEEGYEPYCALYLNPSASFGKLNILYHSTILHSTEYWTADEFRIYIPKAEISHIAGINGREYWYFKYELDSIEGKLLKLFIGEKNIFFQRGGKNIYPFLVFKDKLENESFERYLNENISEIELIDVSDYEYEIKEDKKLGNRNISTESIIRMSNMYSQWKA